MAGADRAGRGGLYSFDALENLACCHTHSAHRILGEHQGLGVGDLVRMGPDGTGWLPPLPGAASQGPDRADPASAPIDGSSMRSPHEALRWPITSRSFTRRPVMTRARR